MRRHDGYPRAGAAARRVAGRAQESSASGQERRRGKMRVPELQRGGRDSRGRGHGQLRVLRRQVRAAGFRRLGAAGGHRPLRADRGRGEGAADGMGAEKPEAGRGKGGAGEYPKPARLLSALRADPRPGDRRGGTHGDVLGQEISRRGLFERHRGQHLEAA